MPEAQRAKVIIGVYAGMIPDRPEPEYTREYALTSDDWNTAHMKGNDQADQAVLLAELNGKAQGYAAWLMLQPDRLNWVRCDWIWL